MAMVNLGRVRGNDGFDPEVTVYEDTQKSYRLRIKDAAHEFLTPNLHGVILTVATVEVLGHDPLIVPLGDLGLDPEKDYTFYAAAGVDYPYLRAINAIRTGNAVRISVYHDTVPYSVPQSGSPFDEGFLKIGVPGLLAGNFQAGEQYGSEPFPVNLLCFENGEA